MTEELRVSRSQFSKLPNGATYYDELGAGPFIKTGNDTRLEISSSPQLSPNQTTIASTNATVIKAPKPGITKKSTPLVFGGDPGAGINNGDPDFTYPGIVPGTPTPYTLTVENTIDPNAPHLWTNRLVWTFPYYPGAAFDQAVLPLSVPVIGLYLQRSTTSVAQPNPSSTFYIVTSDTPAADPNWTTIHTWGPYSHFSDTYVDLVANPDDDFDSSSKPYDDGGLAAPPIFYAYRLIMIIGPTGGHKYQLDWNVVTAIRTFTLTGTSSGGKDLLHWDDPVSNLYTGFTIERSNTPGTWEMLYGSGGSLGGNIDPSLRDSPLIDPAAHFRVFGLLSNGLSVPHNTIDDPTQQTIPSAQFEREFGGKAGVGGAQFVLFKIAVDSRKNIIVVGSMFYTANAGAGEQTVNSNFGSDAFIAKYSPIGVCLWSRPYGSSSNDQFAGLCLDSADNIYTIGTMSGGIDPGHLDFGFGTGTDTTYGGADIIVCKFGPNADLLWHKIFGGTGADRGLAITADSTGVYIAGTMGFFGTGVDFGGGVLPVAGSKSAYLAKLSLVNGSHIWSKSYRDANGELYINDVKIASDGHIVFGAQFKGTANWGLPAYNSAGDYDGAIVKVNATTGDSIWQHKISGTNLNTVNCLATSTGKIFAVGGFYNMMTFNGAHSLTGEAGGSFYLLQLNNDGTYANATSYGVEVNGPSATGVAASDALGVVVTGTMNNGINFGQGWLLGNGANSTFLLRFNADLSVQWSRRGYSGTVGDGGIHVDLKDDIYLVGSGAVIGFDRNSGFNQVTMDPVITIVKNNPVNSTSYTSYWMRFGP